MAETATLTSGAPTHTFTTVPGAVYVLGASGSLTNGAFITLSKALAGSPTVFADLEGASYKAVFDIEIVAPGDSLKATLKNADRGGAGSTSVNLELTERV